MPSYLRTVVILTLATFMAMLDSSVVNVSLPKMAGDLGVAPTETVWIVTSYLVAHIAVIPVCGWLSTVLGRKRFYMICVLLFTISSVLCGLATSLESLIFFRILQGLSGGGIAPTEQAMLVDTVPAEKLGKAFTIYVAGTAVAPILGPVVGGWITDSLSWHWVFLINLPVGIVSLWLTHYYVTERAETAEEKAAREAAKFNVDWVGIVLLVSGVAALEFTLGEGPKENWFDSPLILVTSLVAFFGICGGLVWEYYQENPIFDITLFRQWNFTGGMAVVFLFGFMNAVTTFFLPYMTQILLGYTALQSGMMFLPAAILQVIGMNLIGLIIDRVDPRKLIFIGLIITVFSIWYMTTLSLNTDYQTLIFSRIVFIAGSVFFAATVAVIIYNGIPPEKRNAVSSTFNLTRNISASFGVAVTSTIITVKSKEHISHLAANATEFNQNYVESIRQIAQSIKIQGVGATAADNLAHGIIWNEIVRRGTMQAVQDALGWLLILSIICVPSVFLMKKKS